MKYTKHMTIPLFLFPMWGCIVNTNEPTVGEEQEGTSIVEAQLSGGCAAGVWTQVDFFVNPFWPVAPRIRVFGTPSFTYRWYGTAFPFYLESGLINGSWSDVLIPPSVGTTLEVKCTTSGTFTD